MNLVLIIISIIFIDQLSKYIIFAVINYHDSINIINNLLRITPHHNYGAAWGILNGQLFFIIIMTLLGIFIIIKFMKSFKQNKRNILAFCLLLGGIIGNFIDRILFGYVRDYIDINIIKYNFPIFNIADMCIVISVILLIWAIIKGEDKNENQK